MNLDPIQIYAVVMLVLLVLLWSVYIPLKIRADRRWKERRDYNIEMLRKAFEHKEE